MLWLTLQDSNEVLYVPYESKNLIESLLNQDVAIIVRENMVTVGSKEAQLLIADNYILVRDSDAQVFF